MSGAGGFDGAAGWLWTTSPQESAPSYAELVTIHNAELSALDRLERKREALIQKHEAALRPSTDDALQLLGEALGTTNPPSTSTDPEEAADPNAMLDRAVQDAQNAQDSARNLLDSLGRKPVEDEKQIKRRKELEARLKTELAELDAEIAKQKERVRRAAQARDAAETGGR